MVSLRIGIRDQGRLHVVDLDVEDQVKVHELAHALHCRGTSPQPNGLLTLIATPPDRGAPYRVDPIDTVKTSGLRSGCEIQVEFETLTQHLTALKPITGHLTVTHVSGAAAVFSLTEGTNTVGSDRVNRIVLPGDSVPPEYGTLRVDSRDVTLQKWAEPGATLALTERRSFTIGDYRAVFERVVDRDISSRTTFLQEWWKRPQHTSNRYVVPRITAQTFQIPSPPDSAAKLPVPWIAIIVPIVLGVTLFAFTRSPFTLMIIAFSPVFAFSAWLDQRIRRNKTNRQKTAEYHAKMRHIRAQFESALEQERGARTVRAPGSHVLERALLNSEAVVWSQVNGDVEACEVRLGTGSVLSAVEIAKPPGETEPISSVDGSSALLDESVRELDAMPVTLPSQGLQHFGAVGGEAYCTNRVRDIVLQQCVLYSPQQLEILLFSDSSLVHDAWRWTHWLPHVTPKRGVTLDTKLRQLRTEIDRRRFLKSNSKRLLVVCDLASHERLEQLKQLADGPDTPNVEFLWTVREARDLPRPCHTWITHRPFANDPSSPAVKSVLYCADQPPQKIDSHDEITDVQFSRVARELAGLNPMTPGSQFTSVPDSVTFEALQGVDLVRRSAEVQKRWRRSERTPSISLSVPIGVDENDTVLLDLAAHGPHALVCGMTGSGKSEFLQNWVLALAAEYSPTRATFVLIDFKGGATFQELSSLPHTSGLLTDLAPHLVDRVLKALQAELKSRERLFHQHQVHDLASMRKAATEKAPPQLIIVIDEYATLIEDNPDFIDGIVDIAQRGRSLGVHLILSTQHPGRAVTAAVRANTNLRIALRTASAAESQQIIESAVASSFPQSIPGRAAIRVGAEPPVIVQTGYVGGHTEKTSIKIQPLDEHHLSAAWSTRAVHMGENKATRNEVTKLTKLFQTVAKHQQLPEVVQPWKDPLPTTLPLTGLLPATTNRTHPRPDSPNGRRLDHDCIPWGKIDLPEQQKQPVFSVNFAHTRHCLLVGGGGSGKTEALVTLGTSAAAHTGFRLACICARAHPAFTFWDTRSNTYGVAQIRQTVLVTRLLRSIERYVTNVEHRSRQKILLLIDDAEELFEVHDSHPEFRWEQSLLRILKDGPEAGVHVSMSARRVFGLNSSVRSALDLHIVMTLMSHGEYAQLGLRAPAAPQRLPGRAVVVPREAYVQIAQTSLRDMAQSLGQIQQPPAMDSQASLTTRNSKFDTGVVAANLETGNELLLPVQGVCVVSGPFGSGRTAVADALIHAASARDHSENLVNHCVSFDVDSTSSDSLQEKSEEFMRTLNEMVQRETVHRRDTQTRLIVRISASFTSESELLAQQLSSRFQKLQRTPHLLIIEHDPSNTDGSWELQRKLESALVKVLLWHNASDPRSLATHLRKPSFPLETKIGQGLVEIEREIYPAQFMIESPQKNVAA